LDKTTLLEAYPNPFAGRTTLSFRSAQTGAARLQVFNSLGQLVKTLYNEVAEEGHSYTFELDAKALAAGMYSCRLLIDGQVQTKKLVVVK
jgi:hypothetical protein